VYPSRGTHPRASIARRWVQSVNREDFRWKRNNAQYDTAVGFVVMGREPGSGRTSRFDPKLLKAMSPTFAKAATGGPCRALSLRGCAMCWCVW
jgi:hypothetical protein